MQPEQDPTATDTVETPDTTPDAPAEVAETTEPPEPTFDPERAQATIKKIRSEKLAAAERARKAEDRATAAEDAAKRVPDLEAQLVRERVARKLNLPDALVDRLRGATEDEVMADAESLVALVAPKIKTTRPVESLQPGTGARPGGSPSQLTRSDLAGMTPIEVNAAMAAGRFADLLAGRTP